MTYGFGLDQVLVAATLEKGHYARALFLKTNDCYMRYTL